MKKLLVLILSAALCLGLAACGSPTTSKAAPKSAETAQVESAVSAEAEKAYQDKIAELEEALPEGESLKWTLLSCGEGEKVLVVTKADEVYADGETMTAEIYQYADGEVKYIDAAESGGTAYPVSYTKDAILFAGNHFSAKLEIHNGAAELYRIGGISMDTGENPLLEVYAVENGVLTEKSSEEIPQEKEGDYDYYGNAYADETAEMILFQ